jgi:hypothetical protein
MKRMSQRTIAISLGAAIALTLSLQQSQQSSLNADAKPKDDRGLIDGTVTYEDKKPVNSATVYACHSPKLLPTSFAAVTLLRR